MVETDQSPWASAKVFISYRREETGYAAGWLFDRLTKRFGHDMVFRDLENIELGENFVREIKRAVGSCDVLLALIGDRWLTIRDDQLRTRLDVPGDYVRLEIEAALQRDIYVVPILVAGAKMPKAEALPPSLAGLVERNALELSPSRFDADADKLITVLDRMLTGRWVRLWKRSGLLVGGSAVLILALLLAGYLWIGGNNDHTHGAQGSVSSSDMSTPTVAATSGPLPVSAALPTDAVVVPLKKSAGDRFSLYRVSANGGSGTPLAEKAVFGHGVVLSPDRKTIIYLSGVGNASTMTLAAANGAHSRNFTLQPRPPFTCPLVQHVAWSRADPRVLAVVCTGQQGKTTIVLANLDGSILWKLTSGDDHADDPSFSPDGRRIVFWAGSGGSKAGTLYSVSTSGSGTPSPLASGADSDPAWSTNNVIVFRRVASNGDSAIMAIDYTSRVETTLFRTSTAISMPGWSSTGDRIVYVKTAAAGSSNPNSSQLWIMDADGGNRHALGASGWTLGTPSWGSR